MHNPDKPDTDPVMTAEQIDSTPSAISLNGQQDAQQEFTPDEGTAGQIEVIRFLGDEMTEEDRAAIKRQISKVYPDDNK